MSEIWKDIEGYNGYYMVSDKGNVKSIDRIITKNGIEQCLKGKLLKQHTSKDGYKTVGLSKNNHLRHFRVHRLVAMAFIPNPKNKPAIDHIDGNRMNNVLNNLRWATTQENNTFPIASKNHSSSKKGKKACVETKRRISESLMGNKRRAICVEQYSLDGKTLNVWQSAKEASIMTGVPHSKIIACCKGKRNQTGGFKWGYHRLAPIVNIEKE